MINDSLKIYSNKQLNNIYSYVEDIIETMPNKALNELLGGYNDDVDNLLSEMLNQTANVMNFSVGLKTEDLQYLESLEKHMDLRLRKLSYNYFKTVVLGSSFDQGWRNLEWGNLTQLYPWSSYICSRESGKSYEWSFAFSLWRLYSYDKPMFGSRSGRDNANRKETCLISNETSLVRKHVKKINEEIKSNQILTEKLNPNNKANLGADSITTETGSSLWIKSYGSAIRGLHVGAAVVDDFLDSSSLYSAEQRAKFNEIFFSEIINIVNEGGYLLAVGTPFHELDLYNDLKLSKEFQVFEYPAILPNGTVLAPDRFSIDQLRKKKGTLSPIQYAREILVTPLSDNSTIFPMETLMNSTIGMEKISLINDRDSIDKFPVKFTRVVVGCDFAKSANIGADFSVFSVWASCPQGNFYLLHIWRKQGASYNEQLQQILSINRRFKPNRIVIENNGFQSWMGEGLRAQGLHGIVKPFTTTAQNKKDLYLGLPSLATMFERGQIKIPYASGHSKDIANWLFGEFNSITFNSDNGKLESTAGHDDGPMSSFMAVQDLRDNTSQYKFYYA